MVNWKKEGYSLDSEVFIVKHMGLSNEKRFIKGKVVYIGTKNMNVSVVEGENERILKFNGSKHAKGSSFGFYYTIYNSEKEYAETVLREEKTAELKKYISDKVQFLSLNELEELKGIIDNYLPNVKL